MGSTAFVLQQKEAIRRLWDLGVLSYKLDESQRILHRELLEKRGIERMVLLASRGWGKTFVQLLMAFEQCIQGVEKPDGTRGPAQVAFVTKTKRQARANLRQSAETILADCPKYARPTYLKNESEYVFPNGSVLSLVGVDSERFDFLRGRALDGVCVDESQDIDELDTVVRVVLDPCVLRRRGWMLLCGTVPQRDTHDFVQFVRDAQGTGHCITKTILECPRYDDAQKKEMCRRAGGEASSVWKREYLVKMQFSDERQVIPEFNTDAATSILAEVPRPEFCDKYVGLDFGFARDLTVAVLGYWDFAKARLVIEDEISWKGCTTAKLAELLESKYTTLWGDRATRGAVHEFADGNEGRTIFELNKLHGLRFKATAKVGKEMWINQLRMLVSQDRIRIAPRCKLLSRTLYSATWAKNFSTYERSGEVGHADALDAVLYLLRNVDQKKNPFPGGPGHWLTEGGFSASQKPLSSAGSALASCFGDPSKDVARLVASRFGRRRRF